MTALAIRDDQSQFDDYQVAVLRQSGVDEDVTNAELAAFLHTCQRRQLDPFAGQIYLIGRYDNRKGRKVYKPQTSIDGFRVIARRAADKSGIDYAYEDTIWFDDKGGRHEVWLSDGPPAAAKVVVVRNGNRYDAVARHGAYVQTNRDGDPTGQWKNMADVMIAKCAESLALRKAFPEDLGGLYTAEEMAQADNPQTVRATAEVVRDEPDPWVTDMAARAKAFASDDDGRGLWKEIAEAVHEGKCPKPVGAELQKLISARWRVLGEQAKAAADAEPIEGVIVDPADEWALGAEGVGSHEDAEKFLAELDSADMDEDRRKGIRQIVTDRLADLGEAA